MASVYIDLPVVSGGGGAVESVNGYTGVVVLTSADITSSTDKRYVTDEMLSLLSNIDYSQSFLLMGA